MKLTHLHVISLPGLDDPFDLEPGAGVNVILGPNAVGKSSVARAVRGLFWPGRAGAAGHLVTGRFAADGGTFEAERRGGPDVAWRRDGETVPPPAVPGGHLADCYRLGAVDLLVAGPGTTDAKLALEIRRAMTGGVDLDGLLAAVGRPHKPRAKKLSDDWQEAQAETGRIGRMQQGLAHRLDGLDELEAELAAAEEARTEVETLRAIVELGRARAALAVAEETAARFPAATARVREDDARAFETLRSTIAHKRARLEELDELAAARDSEIAELGGAFDLDTLLAQLDAKVEARRKAQAAADTADGRRDAAEKTWQQARAELGDPDNLPDDDSLPDGADLADLIDRHRAALEEQAQGAALERLAEKIQPGSPSPGWRPGLLAGAGIVLAAAPLVPEMLSERMAWSLFAAGMLLVGLGILDVIRGARTRVRQETADDLETMRSRAAEPAAPGPAPWTLGGRLDAGGWVRDLENLRAAVRARAEHRTAHAAAQTADARLAETLAAWNLAVSSAGLSAVATSAAADDQLAALRTRREHLARLAREQETARAERHAVATDQRERRRELADLLKRLDLPADTVESGPVHTLVEQREPWRRADEELRDRRREVARLEAAGTPGGLADLDPADLQIRLAAAGERAAGRDELLAQRTRLEVEVEAARAGHDRAAALAAEDRRRDDLLAWRDQARARSVRAALVAELSEAHEQVVMPPQLETANEFFARFTEGRHALKVAGGPDGPAFQVRDHETGRWLHLHEISDGTRAQLLLAVRLSFLQHAEGGTRPPLFLDESLTTADGRRLRAIAGGLGELAAQGRQLFYLTSNPADVGAWTKALAARDLPEPTVLDLAAIRGRGAAAAPGDLAAPTAHRPPAPGTLDLAAYGEALGVRRFDPREAWETADTFYLAAPDQELIGHLRELGLAKAGSLAAELARDGGLIEDAMGERLELALAVLRAFVASWRIGRPRRTTAADIHASGAVSDTMRTKVLDLLDRRHGNGAALITALRAKGVSGFRTAKIDDLEAYLGAEGCLDDRAPLDRDSLLLAVQQRLGAGGNAERTPRREVRMLVDGLLGAVPQTMVEGAVSPRSSGSGPTG